MKIFKLVSKEHDESLLQLDLNNIQNWCKDNFIKINIDKTKFMSYTRKTNYYVSNYTIDGVKIEKTNSIKDLGIVFDDSLRFNNHVNTITSEARRIIGFIFRQWPNFKNHRTYIHLYQLLVRPKIEFGSTVWNDIPNMLTNKLESVQKCFVRLLCFKMKWDYYSLNYNNLSTELGIESLALRRIKLDRKFITGILESNIISEHVLSNIGIKTTLHSLR